MVFGIGIDVVVVDDDVGGLSLELYIRCYVVTNRVRECWREERDDSAFSGAEGP